MFGIQGVLQRYGLGILHIGRFAFVESRIIFVGNFFRTFFSADAAGDTFSYIDIARMPGQMHLKITGRSIDAVHFRKRQQLDIDVPADLDQSR